MVTRSKKKTAKHRSRVVEVSPETAKRMLANRLPNRKIQSSVVDRYLAAMKRGEWVEGESVLAVDEDGKLVDGQHRLQAVVRLGKPVSFRIEHGVPPEFAEVIDTGMKRSLSHTLQMRGFANSSTLAAALKMVHVYSLDKRFKMHALRKDPQTNLSLRIFLEKRVPDLPESVRKMQRLAGKMARLFPVSLAATLHYLFSKEDVEAADYFFETLAKGASDLGEGDPVFALREQLIKQSRRPHGMKMSRHMYMALAIKAWNALQDGHQVMNLRWRTAGPQAEQFPLISTNSGKPIEV